MGIIIIEEPKKKNFRERERKRDGKDVPEGEVRSRACGWVAAMNQKAEDVERTKIKMKESKAYKQQTTQQRVSTYWFWLSPSLSLQKKKNDITI